MAVFLLHQYHQRPPSKCIPPLNIPAKLMTPSHCDPFPLWPLVLHWWDCLAPCMGQHSVSLLFELCLSWCKAYSEVFWDNVLVYLDPGQVSVGLRCPSVIGNHVWGDQHSQMFSVIGEMVVSHDSFLVVAAALASCLCCPTTGTCGWCWLSWVWSQLSSLVPALSGRKEDMDTFKLASFNSRGEEKRRSLFSQWDSWYA